ncbi:MAG: signal peptidase I [Bacteroidia bacterium]|nr:signal peptidase I [Bacteroidia bacterium]
MSTGLIYLIVYIVTVLMIRFGLSLLFKKAGEESWKAFVPVLSDIVWVKLINKPLWWVILCFVPMARTLLKVQMRIDLVKAFNKHKFWEHIAAVIVPFIYFPYIGMQEGSIPEEKSKKRGVPSLPTGTVYIGPDPKNHPERSWIREWGDAILYAGSAALIIRTLYFEAFMIPTTSMERTLMAGDFLFVSKFHYGCRTPMLPVAFPFVHNQLPFVGGKSYLSSPKLPYYRLPGLTKVKRNDIVVFNYPAHDIDATSMPYGKIEETSMKENYIKRCVGMPGDLLEVKDAQLYINNQPGQNPENMQFKYLAESAKGTYNLKMMEKAGFRVQYPNTPENRNADFITDQTGTRAMFSCNHAMRDQMKKLPITDTLFRVFQFAPDSTQAGIYPSMIGKYQGFSLEHSNVDNFGPLKIPKKGEAITLTPENFRNYVRCITAYEGHTFDARDNKFFIDGKETTTWIPGMDYFFMMGDNRHDSADSRFWGFVPENHIVGTPIFIFFSAENFFNPKSWRLGRIGTGKIH